MNFTTQQLKAIAVGQEFAIAALYGLLVMQFGFRFGLSNSWYMYACVILSYPSAIFFGSFAWAMVSLSEAIILEEDVDLKHRIGSHSIGLLILCISTLVLPLGIFVLGCFS